MFRAAPASWRTALWGQRASNSSKRHEPTMHHSIILAISVLIILVISIRASLKESIQDMYSLCFRFRSPRCQSFICCSRLISPQRGEGSEVVVCCGNSGSFGHLVYAGLACKIEA